MKKGIKNHACEICGKKFGAKYVLKSHISTVHEGNRDHFCETCGKAFSDAGYLRDELTLRNLIKKASVPRLKYSP